MRRVNYNVGVTPEGPHTALHPLLERGQTPKPWAQNNSGPFEETLAQPCLWGQEGVRRATAL